ncbi:hypothetical protein ACXR0O_29380 [Verrucomicrobiota bacterium sgz303538]
MTIEKPLKSHLAFWFGGIAGVSIAIVAFWIYSLQAPGSAIQAAVDSGFRTLRESAEMYRYCGPVIGSLYLLMVLGFILSVFLAFRRQGTVGAFSSALSPFVIGAFALWISFFPFVQHTTGGMYEGDYYKDVRRIQWPFESGLVLSAIGLAIYFAASNPRKANEAK